jgi:uncharacterized protein
MIVDQTVAVAVSPERAWGVLMDIPTVATCVPGVESVTQEAEDTWAGVIGVKVGPIGVRLEGKVTVAERDDENHVARFDIEATNRRIRGAVNAKTTLTLRGLEDGTSELLMHTDASILGKLGQFGQAVLKKKSDQLLGEFAKCLSAKLAEPA